MAFRLVHRGRSVPRGLLKLASGLLLLVGAHVGLYLAAGGPELTGPLSILIAVWVVVYVWLAEWGVFTVMDGATDLIARSKWRVHGGREMVLDPDGVHYRGDFLDEDSPPLIVPWDDVVGAEFRLGPEGSWWYCLDAPEHRFTGPRHWRISDNVIFFGTPLAVNLEICPGARPGRLDRALRGWTDGRVRCRLPEPPWWRPPPFPPFIRPRRRIRT